MTSTTAMAPDRPHALGPCGGYRTLANAITVARTVAAVLIGCLAVDTAAPRLLAVAYAIYWLGDILDGWTARRLNQETRFGAVLDIVSDRACTAVLMTGLVAHVGGIEGVLPVAVAFLLCFMVLDTMLSLAFLCWPLKSPNDFHLVDQTVWRLNWSPLAKSMNTAGVVGLLLVGLPHAALVLALAVIGAKLWSGRRTLSLLGAR